MVRLAGDYKPHAVLARQANGVLAADVRHPLAEGGLPIEVQTAAALADDGTLGFAIDFAGEKLFDIEGQELDAVGIDAAEIGRDQAGGGDGGFVFGNGSGFEDSLAEGGELSSGDGGHCISAVGR